MMSPIEVSKRRSRFKHTPPGLPNCKASDINNNYSFPANGTTANYHVRSGTSSAKFDSLHIATVNLNGKKDLTSILQTIRSNSDVTVGLCNTSDRLGAPSHMMPAIEVAIKRAKDHMAPPGFKQLPVLDTNNNAGKSDRRGSKKEKLVTHKSPKASDHPTRSGLTVINCIKAVKSEIFLTPEEIESLKPKCLKGEEDSDSESKLKKKKPVTEGYKKQGKGKFEGGLKKMKERMKQFNLDPFRKRAQGTIFVDAVQRSDMIGGQEVVVNVLTFNPEEQEDVQEVQIRDVTPDGFLETFEYFEMVSETRVNMTRIAYTLGDLLVAGVLLGEKHEWATFNQKLLEEERVWKKRCREDDEFFKKRGRSMYAKTSFRTHMREYYKYKLAEVWRLLSDVCPCLC